MHFISIVSTWTEYVDIATLTPIFLELQADHEKYAWLCLYPVKLCLYLGHSAAPNS